MRLRGIVTSAAWGRHWGSIPTWRRPSAEMEEGERVSVAVITGSSGLIGSEAAIYFGTLGLDIVGVDNDMRRVFFGADASTDWNRARVQETLGKSYVHHDLDIRDREGILSMFRRYGEAVELVIHAAAQPSHDWAARQPFVDFDINAVGTLNLLEAVRLHAAEATFIFTSTNKVYGDRPNSSRCASWRHAGRSTPSTPTGTASGRTCPSTTASIASSAPRRSLPTSWFRSTVATTGSARPASGAEL